MPRDRPISLDVVDVVPVSVRVGAMEPTYLVPVRATSAQESNRLAAARRAGPFVAWRAAMHVLTVHPMRTGKPITIGRSADCTITFDHQLVSREHAEVLLRTRTKPTGASVFVLDLRSKHGTALRPLSADKGVDTPSGPLRPAPSQPASPLRLAAGDHDIQLAGEVWLRVGGVRVDDGATGDREPQLARPTRRERDVLVELCRSQFTAQRAAAATPSNAQIGTRMKPPIGAERVSDLLSQLYAKYGLKGTKEQNRVKLVALALELRLVRAEDYG